MPRQNRLPKHLGLAALAAAMIACAAGDAMDAIGELARDAGAMLMDAGAALMDAGSALHEAGAGDAHAATDSATSDAPAAGRDASPAPPRAPLEAQCTHVTVQRTDYTSHPTILAGSYTETRTYYAVLDVAADDVIESLTCAPSAPVDVVACPAGATCATTGAIPNDECATGYAYFVQGRAYVSCGTEYTQHFVTTSGTTDAATGRHYQRARVLLR